MKLSSFIQALKQLTTIHFVQLDGIEVPDHFHVTEVGLITKHFIDCGGVVRKEKKINFQLWVAGDLDHHLEPSKLVSIIQQSEALFEGEDPEIEIEYQQSTIGKFEVDFVNSQFHLVATHTNCLAQDHCGIPPEKMKVNLGELKKETSCCTPGGGCC